MTDLADITKRLRALVIMDEAGSNNPLGRDAADTIERLQASVEAHSLALDERVAECVDLKQKIFALNEQNSTLLRERDELDAKLLAANVAYERRFNVCEAAEAEVVKLKAALMGLLDEPKNITKADLEFFEYCRVTTKAVLAARAALGGQA